MGLVWRRLDRRRSSHGGSVCCSFHGLYCGLFRVLFHPPGTIWKPKCHKEAFSWIMPLPQAPAKKGVSLASGAWAAFVM
ncbi:hypothetical protein EK904_004979 [Melospiza melodia maxima]|nr:hypothetical protein EK904_004979 [Melospiza melodia maxima]